MKTTIKTLPIKDLRFPNVTVCPPKNTFTNLNYDLLMAKNITNETRNLLSDYAFELLHESFFRDIMDRLSILDIPDRYLNWYHGYTRISLPYWRDQSSLDFTILTSASSGFISTQYFGDKYNSLNVKQLLNIHIDITAATSIRKNANYTLHIELEKNSLEDISNGKDSYYLEGYGYLEPEKNLFLLNVTSPQKHYVCNLNRKVSKADIDNMKLKTMPGFRLNWSYNRNVEPESDYAEWPDTVEFVKLVNILQNKSLEEIDKVWDVVKGARREYISKFSPLVTKCDIYEALISEKSLTDNIKKLQKQYVFNSSEASPAIVDKSLLKLAAEMFIFMNYCPKDLFKSPWKNFYKDLFKKETPRIIILTLNRLLKTISPKDKNLYRVPKLLLRKMMATMDLKFEYLYALSNILDNSRKENITTNFELDISHIQRINNHPVHIQDSNGKLNPSTFIPFCGIGMNLSSMGVTMNQFSVPVCNSFRSIVLNDQLCYELNPNEYIRGENIQESLRVGLTLVLDNNEDREVLEVSQDNKIKVFDNNILNVLFKTENTRTALTYIKTIGIRRIRIGRLHVSMCRVIYHTIIIINHNIYFEYLFVKPKSKS